MEMNNSKIKILITGANGFIGSHLISSLIENENYRIGVTLRTYSNIWRIKKYIQNIEYFYIDRENINEIISKFKPDLIIHLAVYYKKKHTYDDLDKMLETNVTLPTKILEAMMKNKVNYFINTGTFTEYLIDKEYLTTQSPISPVNLYSATKVSFEDILKFYTNNYNIKAATLKLFAPYGYMDNPKKLIPYLINCALRNETAETSPGDQKWDFIYVKDVVNAYIKTIDYILDTQTKYSTFNIGSGEAHSIKEIVNEINNFGPKLDIEWGKFPYDNKEIFYAKSDNTLAQNLLKWLPKYTLKQGLLETYNWYKENGYKENE